MKFESDYIEKLAKIIADNDLTEISLEDGEQAITIRKDLPEVGDKIKHDKEDATVISVDIPNRKYTILTESGSKEEIIVPLKCSGKCGKNRN